MDHDLMLTSSPAERRDRRAARCAASSPLRSLLAGLLHPLLPGTGRLVCMRPYLRGHSILPLIVPAGKPGARQTISLPGARHERLVPLRNTIDAGAAGVRTWLGGPVIRGAVLVR
jgi:hypothetical protein